VYRGIQGEGRKRLCARGRVAGANSARPRSVPPETKGPCLEEASPGVTSGIAVYLISAWSVLRTGRPGCTRTQGNIFADVRKLTLQDSIAERLQQVNCPILCMKWNSSI